MHIQFGNENILLYLYQNRKDKYHMEKWLENGMKGNKQSIDLYADSYTAQIQCIRNYCIFERKKFSDKPLADICLLVQPVNKANHRLSRRHGLKRQIQNIKGDKYHKG